MANVTGHSSRFGSVALIAGLGILGLPGCLGTVIEDGEIGGGAGVGATTGQIPTTGATGGMGGKPTGGSGGLGGVGGKPTGGVGGVGGVGGKPTGGSGGVGGSGGKPTGGVGGVGGSGGKPTGGSGGLGGYGGTTVGGAGGVGGATTVSCDEVPQFFSDFAYKCLSDGSLYATWQDYPSGWSDTLPPKETHYCQYSCPGGCRNNASVDPANGAQFLAEACNSTAPIATIGDSVPQIDSLLLTISVTDGFMSYAWSNTYQIDVATRTVTYTWANPIAGSRTAPTPHVETAAATAEQMRALLASVQKTPWRTTTSCMSMAVDGGPYPASLVVTSSLRGKFMYQTTDAMCTPSDHGATGDVISCSSFDAIEALVHAILPGGATTQCQKYW